MFSKTARLVYKLQTDILPMCIKTIACHKLDTKSTKFKNALPLFKDIDVYNCWHTVLVNVRNSLKSLIVILLIHKSLIRDCKRSQKHRQWKWEPCQIYYKVYAEYNVKGVLFDSKHALFYDLMS